MLIIPAILRSFALLISIISFILVLTGPGVCHYIDTYFESYYYCDSSQNVDISEWDWFPNSIYGQIPVIIVPLIYSLIPISISIYHIIKKDWIDPIKQLGILGCGIAIFLVCAAIETFYAARYGTIFYTILFSRQGTSFYVQGWAAAAGLYYLVTITYFIDMVVIYKTQYQNDY
uniref:G_PROTEIN_RECEP_F1_2 domain-containing protein n=1 Tax=Parastrongyloides trichosuri TaxID=131310 RepID=A0A0N4ZPK0_PARTI